MAVLVRNGSVATRRPEEGLVPLSQAMNRLLQDSFLFAGGLGQAAPFGTTAGTNLWETNDDFVLQVALPGIQADALAITVDQNVLTVKGELAVKAPENAKAVWQSLGGQTEFRVQIPGEVDASGAEAGYDAGILTVRLPKAQHVRARTIPVTAK
jgi:HSP20 family protein